MKMRLQLNLLALCFAVLGASAQSAVDTCPRTEHACVDVINSSLCLSQGATANATAETMAKCVTYEGGASNLPGAVKVSLSRKMVNTASVILTPNIALSMLRMPFGVNK
jgi:hypothetical protein